jgi:hypothetical protein
VKLIITRASNGFFLECEEGTAVLEDGENDAETAQLLALSIWEHFGLMGSRHDEVRPYIILAPGDKRDPLPVCPFCDAPASKE